MVKYISLLTTSLVSTAGDPEYFADFLLSSLLRWKMTAMLLLILPLQTQGNRHAS